MAHSVTELETSEIRKAWKKSGDSALELRFLQRELAI